MSSARWQTPTSSAASAARRAVQRGGRVARQRLAVAAHARVAARRVDRVDRLDVGVGAGDAAQAPRRALDQHDHRRVRAAGHEVRACRTRRSARRTPAPAASARAARRCRRARSRARPARSPSSGVAAHGVAELLEQHRQLDGAEPLAAVLLGDRDARASRARTARATARRRRGRASAAARTRSNGERRGEQLARGRLDLRWSSVEVEVHVSAPSAGRARARRRCS